MKKDLPEDDHFRIIADNAPVLIWVSDTNKKCTFFNKGWLTFTGRRLEEELGDGWTEGVHPDDLDRCMEIFSSHFDRRDTFEMHYRLRRHDGQYRYIVDRGAPWFNDDGEFGGYTGSCADVQEQYETNELLEKKVAERTEELRLKNEELEKQKNTAFSIFNASVDVMIVYDKDRRFIALNEAAYKAYNLDESVIGRKVTDVYPGIEKSEGMHDLSLALKGQHVHKEAYKSAVEELYFETFLSPLKNGSEEIHGALVVARDISERMTSQKKLEELNQKLMARNTELQSSNEDLSSFNYVASHDLQEPLRKVSMFASRILENEKNTLSEQSYQYFDRINSAITRMQNLINALLEYSGTDNSDVRRTKSDLNKILKEVLSGLEMPIKNKNAVIDHDILPVIQGVPIQLHQLLNNLISNSLKYSRPEVEPKISVTASQVAIPERDNQTFWKITVTDNGMGFDMAYRQKIFELFERLHGKTEIEGTGIGLAICRKIASNHGGFITAEGESGKGATFSVYLPLKK